jgi:hypothetical protein
MYHALKQSITISETLPKTNILATIHMEHIQTTTPLPPKHNELPLSSNTWARTTLFKTLTPESIDELHKKCSTALDKINEHNEQARGPHPEHLSGPR